MNLEPIAHFKSPFASKFGIPRQSGLVPGLRGEIRFTDKYRRPEAVRGLEGFDYFLRTTCKNLTLKEIQSPEYAVLAERMLVTVTSPEQDGVAIAGPQVGIGRRVVAVQRFDKPGEPFEVYPNIRVTARRGEPEPGPEGCLSVPGRRGDVLRWQDIDIAYTSPATGRDTSETVQGFTAVIFQHETDHLDGVLYIDKLVP